MKTGPLHRAIPLLESEGVIVRPGFDGRKTLPPVSINEESADG